MVIVVGCCFCCVFSSSLFQYKFNLTFNLHLTIDYCEEYGAVRNWDWRNRQTHLQFISSLFGIHSQTVRTHLRAHISKKIKSRSCLQRWKYVGTPPFEFGESEPTKVIQQFDVELYFVSFYVWTWTHTWKRWMYLVTIHEKTSNYRKHCTSSSDFKFSVYCLNLISILNLIYIPSSAHFGRRHTIELLKNRIQFELARSKKYSRHTTVASQIPIEGLIDVNASKIAQ